jgi:hypothetical protein
MGSSHDPARATVAENSLTWGMVADALGGTASLRGTLEARDGRNVVAGDILNPWNALRSDDEAVGFIVAVAEGIGPVFEVQQSSWSRGSKIHIATESSARSTDLPDVVPNPNPHPHHSEVLELLLMRFNASQNELRGSFIARSDPVLNKKHPIV